MTLYLIIIGLISILGQVVILRELNVAFFGIELIYILSLGVWLLGTAVGAFTGRRSFIPSIKQLRILFLVLGIIFPCDVAFIRAIRIMFSDVPGTFLSFDLQMISMSIALLPVSFLLGLIFQWAAKLCITEKRTLAVAYAIESAGGLIGGLASTLFLIVGIQNFSIAVLCGFVAMITAFINMEKRKNFKFQFITILLIGTLTVMFFMPSSIDKWMTSWNHPNLIASEDTPYNRVSITSFEEQLIVFENDAITFETESTASEEFVHLAVLQHPNPKRFLVLGGGIEGIILELMKYDSIHVDYVEINRILIDLVNQHLPSNISSSLIEKNVQIIISDPRLFLNESKNYDVILVGMPEPSSAQSNRYYTLEFFQQCALKLNPDGIIAFRLKSAENLWTPQLTRRNVSIYRAVSSVFDDIAILPGVTNIVMAAQTQLLRQPELLSERLISRSIEGRLVTPEYVNYLYTNDRFFSIAETLESGKAPINTDAKPICYQYTIALWLSKFFPVMAFFDLTSFSSLDEKSFLPLAIILTIIIGLFLFSRLSNFFRRVLLVSLAGFLGMIFETILILRYQVINGVLYQDIGLLLMAFMAGLSAGSLVINQFASFAVGKSMISRWVGLVLTIIFAVLVLLFVWASHLHFLSGLLGIGFLLFLTGFYVAGIFAYASLYKVGDQKAVVSPLYSADLIGGCIGSLIASLLLIPIFGLSFAAYFIAGLSLLSILLL